MNKEEIFAHWKDWASAHGTGLKATTKTPTVKMLEMDALSRQIQKAGLVSGRVLEVGCGNGVNCIGLASAFPEMTFDGVDYVPEMVAAARTTTEGEGRLRFFQGNALDLAAVPELHDQYDVVFTDRCLINLNTLEDQKRGISNAAAKVRPGGLLLMIENSTQTYELQNRYREHLGLAKRTPASYNLFFDENEVHAHLGSIGLSIDTEDFVSLHDLVLYVLVPAINGGEVDYGHPIVEAATRLSMAISAETPNALGAHGQNRLFICRKS